MNSQVWSCCLSTQTCATPTFKLLTKRVTEVQTPKLVCFASATYNLPHNSLGAQAREVTAVFLHWHTIVQQPACAYIWSSGGLIVWGYNVDR